MKRLLFVSLIILFFVFTNSQFEYDEDDSDLLVNKESMKKYEKSLKKLERIMRMLEASSDESSEDDQSSEDIQSSEVLETTIPTGNVTESDESSEEDQTTTPETTTPETTEPTYDPLVEPTIPADIVYPPPPTNP